MAHRRVLAAVVAVAIHATGGARAFAADSGACEVAAAEMATTSGGQQPVLKLTGGADAARVWVTGEHDGLSIRKFTAKGGASVIEFSHGDDKVVISVSKERLSIGRKGVAREFTSAASVEEIQALLGGSSAVYRTRVLLSQFERTSALKAGSMSVLSAAAFLAALTGDVDAPARLTERFLEKHRKAYRLVRASARSGDDEASCWSTYTDEVDAAWKAQNACVKEQTDLGWFLLDSRINMFCTSFWFVRVEAAWFELLKCTGVSSFFPKIE